jgi:uncharacterized membrane protein
MAEWKDWIGAVSRQRRLVAWRHEGVLDVGAFTRAQEVLATAPAAAQWRRFLDGLALWLGVILLASGAICFIAANWDRFDRLTHLFGMQAVLAAAVAAVGWLGLARVGGQATLLLATLLLGGLLALVGQTYQTGADTWELFALWAALALPWVLAGRSVALWLLWAAVLNVAAALWLQLNATFWFGAWNTAALIGLLDLALLAAVEWAAGRWPEFGGRAAPRLLAAAALLALTINGIADVFDGMADVVDGEARFGAASAAWLLATLALGYAYLRLRPDLPILAMLALSIIVLSTCWLGRVLFEDAASMGAWLILAVWVIGLGAAAVLMLGKLQTEEWA